VPLLENSRMTPLLLRSDPGGEGNQYRATFFMNGIPGEKEGARLGGLLQPGSHPGFTDMTYDPQCGDWKVPSKEILYRLVCAAHEVGFAYLASTELTTKAGRFFLDAGFQIVFAEPFFVRSEIRKQGIAAALKKFENERASNTSFAYADLTNDAQRADICARLLKKDDASLAGGP
jgi:predicted GNAT family acetyltransferase